MLLVAMPFAPSSDGVPRFSGKLKVVALCQALVAKRREQRGNEVLLVSLHFPMHLFLPRETLTELQHQRGKGSQNRNEGRKELNNTEKKDRSNIVCN